MPEQSAFAATAAAHDNKRFAPVNVKRNAIEHRAVSECPDEIVYFDDCFSVSAHELKKKIDVNTALVTNIANKDCTTAAVVA